MDPMRKLVEDFGQQLRDSIQIGEQLVLHPHPDQIHNIALLGLGGSAFGGEITRNLLINTCRVPFTIHRGYDLPAYVGPHSLVLSCSYSGNTEETLEATRAALKTGAKIVVISAGGKLAQLAKAEGLDLILLPEGYPPRAAVGFAFVQQLFVLKFFGLAGPFAADLNEAIEEIEQFRDLEAAKELASALSNKVAIIYASDAIDGLAVRMRQQINENGKQLCWHHVIPEMNHNELVGWELPKDFIQQQAAVVFLRSDYEHPRVKRRFEINDLMIRKHTQNIHIVAARGRSKMAQMMHLMHYIDWVSVFLADKNGVEATPVKVIDYLKGELAKS